MADWTVATLVEDLKAGRIGRRRFIAVLVSAGIGMPLISAILSACGSPNTGVTSSNKAGATNDLVIPTRAAASPTATGSPAVGAAAGTPANAAATPAAFTPVKRGGGGPLKLLWWQAVSILNPHMSSGLKDQNGARIFLEPLADFDQEGNLVPILAAEIPSVEKGTLDPALNFVVWKLKPGVTWHDGQPFTADDVTFTADYIMDPDTAAFSAGHYKSIQSVERIDDLTVKVSFKTPTMTWADPFVGDTGMILPRHVHETYKGKNAKAAPANLKPVGTGPYKIHDFTPNDTVLGDINLNYHVANRPFFDSIELKGGGDATGAAQAVLQTGEYDYAWNLQIPADQLLAMEKAGAGRLLTWNGGAVERIDFNYTDPNTDVDGERSSLKAPHPFFSDQNVRKAFILAIDRQAIVDQLYGPTGVVGTVWDYNPTKYVPEAAATFKADPARANQLLDAAGWIKGGDGIRAKGGKKLHVLFQTTVNDLRQSEQAIVKKNLGDVGVDVELKAVDQAVFLGSDPANSDNAPHFYADLQMYTTGRFGPNDYLPWLLAYVSTETRQKTNNWSKSNTSRYQNPNYDQLYNQLKVETDPVNAADLVKKLNQVLFDDAALIPLVGRNQVSAAKKNLQGLKLSGWANELWWLPFWYRQG